MKRVTIAYWQLLLILAGAGSTSVVATQQILRMDEDQITQISAEHDEAWEHRMREANKGQSYTLIGNRASAARDSLHFAKLTATMANLATDIDKLPTSCPDCPALPDYGTHFIGLGAAISDLRAAIEKQTTAAGVEPDTLRFAIRREGSEFRLRVLGRAATWSSDQ